MANEHNPSEEVLTPAQVLREMVVVLGNEEDDEREYAFGDGRTGRQFTIRQSETLDERGNPKPRFFLNERVPSGRMFRMGRDGHPEDFWAEPALKAIEAEVGPNRFIEEAAARGYSADHMVFDGGGYGVGSIFHGSLADCAEQIAAAIAQDCRYQHRRPLTPQEDIQLKRQAAASRVEYWRAQKQLLAVADGEEGLFKGCHNLLGAPLDGDAKFAILSYLNQPTQEGWLAIRNTMVFASKTLWTAWVEHDPTAPRSGSVGFPDAECLKSAWRNALDRWAAEVETRLAEAEASPHGLLLVEDKPASRRPRM